MIEIDKIVWVGVAHGVESVSGAGAAVWRDPAAARKALGELLSVLPLTHGQIDLDAMLGSGEQGAAAWRSMLDGKSDDSLREITAAINDAFRPPAVWGVGLPCPDAVAALLGDVSERAVLKAGLQIAARLRLFRDAGASFAAIDLANANFAEHERALKPILRNAEMYGWKRALCVPTLADAVRLGDAADAALTLNSRVSELDSMWRQGSAIGGGLTEGVWAGEPLAARQAPRFFLFGRIPAGAPVPAIVDAARRISSWCR